MLYFARKISLRFSMARRKISNKELRKWFSLETGLERIDKLKNAVIDLEKRMFQRRAYSVRAEEITIMSELQVREEKSELQRELLLLESQFGRPSTSSERQACRAIYSRYRELKRKVHQFESRFHILHYFF